MKKPINGKVDPTKSNLLMMKLNKPINGEVDPSNWRICHQMHLSIFNSEVDPTSLNKTRIVLIPMCKNPSQPSDFRSISLCNILFKIITMTIANRLKLVLPLILDDTKGAFMQQRQITNNTLLEFEIFIFLKKKNH